MYIHIYCMYIYIYIYLYIYIYVRHGFHVWQPPDAHPYHPQKKKCLHSPSPNKSPGSYVCVSIYLSICLSISIFIYTYIYVHIHIYVFGCFCTCGVLYLSVPMVRSLLLGVYIGPLPLETTVELRCMNVYPEIYPKP